jgi:hypothetical protein
MSDEQNSDRPGDGPPPARPVDKSSLTMTQIQQLTDREKLELLISLCGGDPSRLDEFLKSDHPFAHAMLMRRISEGHPWDPFANK